jgi:cobalt/nickel transport system permease protein
MHIPDGFVSGPVNLAGYVIAAGAVAVSLRNLNKTLPQERVPMLGVTAAFVFAAQMINFPIGAGTSGHFLGALMSAVLLGPWAACIVMTLVLAVQCLLFVDGGLTALGANIFNMGIVGGMFSYLLFLLLRKILPHTMKGFYAAVGISAWFSIVAASIAAAVELGVSRTIPISVAIPAMGGVHALIGIGEAFITVATMSVVHAARPDLMRMKASGGAQ